MAIVWSRFLELFGLLLTSTYAIATVRVDRLSVCHRLSFCLSFCHRHSAALGLVVIPKIPYDHDPAQPSLFFDGALTDDVFLLLVVGLIVGLIDTLIPQLIPSAYSIPIAFSVCGCVCSGITQNLY